MSNIEKIRQEIERRITDNTFGAKLELIDLLAFIDSLPEERLSEDLEEAAEEYADKHGFRVPYDGSNNYYDDVDVKASKEGFLAGAEWQKGQKPELVRHPPITYTYNSNASRDERLQAALLALLGSDLIQVKDGGYFTKQDLIEWVERIPTDKPAWSEEDRKHLNSVLLSLNRPFYNMNEQEKSDFDWLHELPERFNLQPKQEWSEEDEGNNEHFCFHNIQFER